MTGASNPEMPGASRGEAAGSANAASEAASDAFWKLMEEKGQNRDSKLLLRFITLSFGDGTGFQTPTAIDA